MIKILSYMALWICLNAINIYADQNWVTTIDHMMLNGQYDRVIIQLNNLQKELNPTSKDYLQMQILKANAFIALGRYKQAQGTLLPYQSIINNCSPEIKVRFLNTIGRIDAFFSQTTKASHFFQESLVIAKHSGSAQLYRETLNEIGLLYYAHLDKHNFYRSAINAFHQAITCVSLVPKSYFNAQLMINLARVYVKKNAQGHAKERLQALKDARDYVSNLPDTFKKGCLLVDIARLYENISQNNKKKQSFGIHQAHQIYIEAEQVNHKINDLRLASLIYYQMGGLYKRTKQFDEAISLTQRSLFYAQQIQDMYTLYLNNWQLGSLYRHTDKIQKAIHHYDTAIQQLAPIRQQIYHSDLTQKNVFNRKIKPVYLELSEIYFELASSEIASTEKYNNFIKKAWATMDEVKSAELEDIFDDPCVAYQKEEHLNLDSDFNSVAVIYFVPFPEKPGLIMRLPNGFKHLRLDIDTQAFNEIVYRLRNEIPAWGIFETDAARLYELIISPIYEDLKQQDVKTLVVASDGAMRLLPFSIFFSPDEKFLIEEFEIVTIPALHLTRLGQTNRDSPKGLFCGITQAHTIGNIKFEALPRISKELETITKIVPGDVFMDEEFTLPHLKSIIAEKKYSVIHLATHGEFGSIPEKTFLVAHKSPLTMNSLEKIIKQNRSSAIDLLVLSACQTAIGDERAAFGLAGGAVKAGAKCAIATLWSVDDFASQQIFSDFYRNVYQKKYSKAKAMQKAQLMLLERIQFWHPAIWSAFLVIGNWY